jgi:hypothetical protein
LLLFIIFSSPQYSLTFADPAAAAANNNNNHQHHRNNSMEEYHPEPLPWRSFTAEELERGGGIGLWEEKEAFLFPKTTTALREKPYVLDNSLQSYEDQWLAVPPVHLTQDLLRLEDFRVVPSELSDDARRSGLDDNAQRLALTVDQKQSLRQTGRIVVPSHSFPGQNHTWQVARGVYSGTDTIKTDLRAGGGVALDQLVYSMDAVGSLQRSGWQRWLRAVTLVLDGATQFLRPYRPRLYHTIVVDRLVDEAKESYVRKRMSELHHHDGPVPMSMEIPDAERYYKNHVLKNELWQALQTHGNWSVSEPPTDEEFTTAKACYRPYTALQYQRPGEDPGPFTCTTTMEREISARVSPRAAQKLQQQLHDAAQTKKRQRWIDLLLNASSSFGPDLAARYEADWCRDNIAAADEEEVVRKAEAQVAAEEKRKASLWSIRHMMLWSKVYRSRRVGTLQNRERARLATTFPERLAQRLREPPHDARLDLNKEATRQQMAAEFDQLHGPRLRQTLAAQSGPPAPVQFHVLQLNPAHWSTPRNGDLSSCDRTKVASVDLSRPLWRTRYAFLTFWTTLKRSVGGSLHFLANGPLSFRALFAKTPYYGITRPIPDPSTLTSTLSSRLRHLFETLANQRVKFENEPDVGILPKSITRPFFHIRQLVKGIVGVTSIVVFMVAGTVISSIVCSVWILTSPVIAVLWMVAVTAFQLFVYDTALAASKSRPVNYLYGPTYPKFNCAAPVLKLAIMAPWQVIVGVLEVAVATIRAIVIHPLCFAGLFVASLARSLTRVTRDSLTWPLLQRLAQVPATSDDTWLAHRISGPGVSAQYYSRLPLEAAKVAVLRVLDMERLAAHRKLREIEMDAPYQDYVGMFDLSRFGIQTSSNCATPTSKVQHILQSMGRPNHYQTMRRRLKGQDVRTGWEALTSAIWKEDAANQESVQEYESTMQTASEDNLAQRAASLAMVLSDDDAERLQILVKTSIGKGKPASPLERLRNSSLMVLSRWFYVVDSFRELLAHLIVVPTAANGNFRLSEEEVESLWQFTITTVETFRTQHTAELLAVGAWSPWIHDNDVERAVVGTQDALERSSTAVRSFRLLVSLFGLDGLTETLEDLDRSMVFEKIHWCEERRVGEKNHWEERRAGADFSGTRMRLYNK